VKLEKRILLFLGVLFILYAYFKTDMRIRYIAPAIPPLVILSIFGIYRIHHFLNRPESRGRGLPAAGGVILVVAGILIFNTPYIIEQFRLVDPFSYISGRVDRAAYIGRYRPEYPVISYANDHLAADARLMGLFMGNRRYYSDRDLVFGRKQFLKIVKAADTSAAIRSGLQQQGFSHLVIRFDLFNNWVDKQFSAREKKMLKGFFSEGTTHMVSNNGFGLFELADIQKPFQN
jgi:hypothetical protein